MKITRIETFPVLVPINSTRAIQGGRGKHSASPFLMICIHTDGGIYGIGEVSCTPGWSGEDNVTAAHFINSILSPILLARIPPRSSG